jgi:DNA-binding MarR family transcriptional regulator
MPSTGDQGAPALAPETAEVLQAATRVLAGVALRSLDVLDAAVTLPQFRLLAVLAELGPVPSGQAARTLGLDRSTVTRLADRMVAAGYVARGTDPRHRGVVTLELTPGGKELVAAADAWRQQELARIMARLAPGDRTTVTAALGLLVSAAGQDYGITAYHPVPLLPLRPAGGDAGAARCPASAPGTVLAISWLPRRRSPPRSRASAAGPSRTP